MRQTHIDSWKIGSKSKWRIGRAKMDIRSHQLDLISLTQLIQQATRPAHDSVVNQSTTLIRGIRKLNARLNRQFFSQLSCPSRICRPLVPLSKLQNNSCCLQFAE